VTKRDIYMRVLAIQQTADAQDGGRPDMASVYLMLTGLLEELHADLQQEDE
jgi:hypothetical protein